MTSTKPPAVSKWPWRSIARLAWWSIAALTIALDGYGFYLATVYLPQVCSGAVSDCNSYQLNLQNLHALNAAGLTIQFYAATILITLALSSLAWVGMGLVLFVFKSNDRAVFIISLALITFGSVAFGTLDFAGQAHNPSLALLTRILGIIGQVSFVIFYLFPDGRFFPGWTRWLALAWAALWLPRLALPDYSPLTLFPPVFLAYIGSVILAQAVRYRSLDNPLQRQQIKWVVFSIVLAFAYFLAFLIVGLPFPALAENPWFQFLSNLLLIAAMGLIPISVGIAMLRYRLWDIDFIIRRTLVYGSLTAFLGLVYFASVVLLQLLFRTITGEISPVAVVISTLAIAALFSPVRQAFQRAIDRRFYRSRYDAARALESFTAAARDEVDLDQLTRVLVMNVSSTLQPEKVSIWLRPGERND